MYGLSREASTVRKDSNNECRGVSRGRSSRPRAGQGEGPNCALSHTTVRVIGNFSSQMSEEELSSQDDRAYPDNREEVTMSIMRSYNEIRSAQNRRMPNGTYGGVRGTETKVGQKTFVSRPTRLSLPRRDFKNRPTKLHRQCRSRIHPKAAVLRLAFLIANFAVKKTCSI